MPSICTLKGYQDFTRKRLHSLITSETNNHPLEFNRLFFIVFRQPPVAA